MQSFPADEHQVRLRIRREGEDFMVEWAGVQGQGWTLLRVAHLHEAAAQPLQCGWYACSPKGSGFRAEFEFLQIVRS